MLKKIFIAIIATASLTACVEEEEYSNSARGNFEALWSIIDERYCFFDEAGKEFGLNWNEVY